MAKDEWTKLQVSQFTKKAQEKVYCQLCGREIILYSGELDKYRYEIREEAHVDCIRRYQQKMAQKHKEQQEQ